MMQVHFNAPNPVLHVQVLSRVVSHMHLSCKEEKIKKLCVSSFWSATRSA